MALEMGRVYSAIETMKSYSNGLMLVLFQSPISAEFAGRLSATASAGEVKTEMNLLPSLNGDTVNVAKSGNTYTITFNSNSGKL